jgi:hypothetical protein
MLGESGTVVLQDRLTGKAGQGGMGELSQGLELGLPGPTKVPAARPSTDETLSTAFPNPPAAGQALGAAGRSKAVL